MKFRKSLYLALALVLPIGIFLFLKFFGKNQFDVEPLFQEKVDLTSGCDIDYSFPYILADSVADVFLGGGEKLALIVFMNDSLQQSIRKQINRLKEEFPKDPVTIKELKKNFYDSDLKKCILIMPDHLNIVLIDSEKRIRGQYDASSLEDMDRLIVEMKIILKRY